MNNPLCRNSSGQETVQDKPNLAGAQVLRCCSRSVAHDFESYQRKGTSTSMEHKNLELGGFIVMRLMEMLLNKGTSNATLTTILPQCQYFTS